MGDVTRLLDQGERLDPQELRALQLERLQATLRHAYENVPFHREAFDRAGVRPEDCRSLADLARFPFTSKADLRATYPCGMFAVPRERIRRFHASSGTTGRPTIVGYTDRDLSLWADMVARSLRAAGARPGDVVHVAYGYGLFTGGLGAHYGAERLGCTVVPASGGMTSRQVQLIQDLKPRIIMVTPSYMLTLLDEFERQGVDPRSTSLQVGVFGAEPWTQEMRREIEERCGIDAVDIYGLSEVIGPGVAQECVETKDGLHIWEDHFYPEIVDPITGEVLPDGEEGELVFTSLTKEAMPVIRYRTRDLTRLLPGTARIFRRMEKVTGRSDDMVIVRGVNLFPTQIEEIVLRTPGVAPHFQLRLTREGRMDALTVRAEARPDADAAIREAAARSIAVAVKEGIGVSAGVEIVEPGTLERSVGKIKRIMDLRS
ncbi:MULTISPECIES: phenylacetate--CoA ligase PaaK [Streptomyces]|uniref:Phenylacetate-coenzyme A ligase n=1 Tax=Streptomyces thermoviolaceus subsp. thermoviolaceus TaxID=66860 RepID=A0ABX0YQ64_STRTL|nr:MULTISPECIES: phenylacetate--CoA ligase PaaK [Streptomyces]MCM3262510.1 phenylacetate--CoA ligase [Streptomyces thermoviolaceus]NJP14069.1 phenylacetate--CoA ligase [Streptomyces thermoviolaceus subsp. thermoviolaceus]RSR97301.1 phenylacetate--CoA ligase [Streptomyces sp. WAC00469]WTD50420.1 phenylacetate--CoA ligase [Streptomyces thermoviolaceus]GGV63228.1 phenylacetate-coenzyme A ligase [Streptomyces thermoviolaceus subsp. apingens]